ncbi:MAG: protease inhibitor I42 family protein [Firmicutes bacterium]|nr:protease inhibitor I42 family protein [Bacillota bacterium]
MKNFLSVLLIAMMLVFPATAAAQLTSADFSDVRGLVAAQDIELMANLGVMIGTGTNGQGLRLFSPDENVTRAQLAVVLQRTFQLDYGPIRFIKPPLATDYYRDVDNQAWYADGLVMCAINNIFANADNFYPDRAVNRIEIAQSVYRSFNAKGISVPMIMIMPIFEDTRALTQEQINAIIFVNNTGIMQTNSPYFRPAEGLNRGELAQVLSRCVSLISINDNYNGQEYRVPAGQTFIIALSSNPTTGFSWTLKNAGDGQLITPVVNFYLSDAAQNQSLVGQGGKEYWQFKALQAGSTDLQLIYARPWESVQPAQFFNLKVVVTQP